MIVWFLLLIVMGAGEPLQDQRLIVTLEPETFPAGFDPEFGKPLLFRLFSDPIFPVVEAPEVTDDIPVYGTLSIGALTDLPMLITQRSDTGEDYTALYLDLNFNGDFTDDGSPWNGERVRKYGHVTIVFSDILFSLSREAFRHDMTLPNYPTMHKGHVTPKEVNLVTPQTLHLCTLRLSLATETEVPRIAHLYYRCWKRGIAEINGIIYNLCVIDDDGNGYYNKLDRWSLVRADATDPFPGSESLFPPISDTFRLGEGDLWQIVTLRPDGSQLLLAPTDRERSAALSPSMHPPAPPLFPLAEKEVAWETSFQVAIEKAARTGRPILLLLTAPECAFSRAYLDVTFHDANIVELVRSLVPVHIELEQNEVTDKIKVPGFPYILFLNEKLVILKRVSGYCTAPVLAEYLKSVIRAHPSKTE